MHEAYGVCRLMTNVSSAPLRDLCGCVSSYGLINSAHTSRKSNRTHLRGAKRCSFKAYRASHRHPLHLRCAHSFWTSTACFILSSATNPGTSVTCHSLSRYCARQPMSMWWSAAHGGSNVPWTSCAPVSQRMSLTGSLASRLGTRSLWTRPTPCWDMSVKQSATLGCEPEIERSFHGWLSMTAHGSIDRSAGRCFSWMARPG